MFAAPERLPEFWQQVLQMRADYIPTAVIAAYKHRPEASFRRAGGGVYADVLTTSGESIAAYGAINQASLLLILSVTLSSRRCCSMPVYAGKERRL